MQVVQNYLKWNVRVGSETVECFQLETFMFGGRSARVVVFGGCGDLWYLLHCVGLDFTPDLPCRETKPYTVISYIFV